MCVTEMNSLGMTTSNDQWLSQDFTFSTQTIDSVFNQIKYH